VPGSRYAPVAQAARIGGRADGTSTTTDERPTPTPRRHRHEMPVRYSAPPPRSPPGSATPVRSAADSRPQRYRGRQRFFAPPPNPHPAPYGRTTLLVMPLTGGPFPSIKL